MMNITDFNKTVAFFDFDKDKERPYVKLENLFETDKDEVHKVLGLYINEGKFGEQASVVMDDVCVSLPLHYTDTVKQILESEKIVQDINEGKVGFTIYKYTSKNYNTESYAITWVDLSK